MRLLRSWPRRVPDGAHHVADTVERLVIDNHNYRPLGDVDDDVLLLEWDIAVGRDELREFAEQAAARPGSVLVAPYRLYLPHTVWAHRHWAGAGSGIATLNTSFVATGDPTCNLFGLGMAYLPRRVVRDYLDAQWANHFGDVEFSTWHYHHVARDVPIAWRARPVHLHYPIPRI